MISPQGYKLGAAPGSENPFWGEGEDSDVNKIFATATVDEGTGVPSVTTTKQISGNDITFGFNFHNLKGERGAQGPTGATGATGPAGPAGADGKDGATGATGATGPQGPEGPKGDTGATGPQGEQGEQGEKGTDGFSPQIILTPIPEGYHMKIIDATGEQEITIADGKDGATGPQGPEGPAGPQGEPGAAGAAGKDGVSPSAMVEQTGENEATIYVTDASGTTAAVLTGEAGPEGPAGPQGEKGETGATGPEGPQGETGPQGPEGPAGPQGETGPQGEKGDTGATGETGATGPAGPGVAAGGTAGQVLTKKSGTDYDTEWKDASGGSSIKTLKVDSAYISLFFGSGKTFGDGSLKFDVAFKSSDNTIAGFCSRNNDSTSTSAGCLVATLKNIASSNTIIGVKMCNVFVGDGSTFTEKSIDYDLVFNNRLSASSLAGGIDLFFVYHTQALSESVAKYAQAKTASDTYFTITYLEGTA